jgi:hypothetical protein
MAVTGRGHGMRHAGLAALAISTAAVLASTDMSSAAEKIQMITAGQWRLERIVNSATGEDVSARHAAIHGTVSYSADGLYAFKVSAGGPIDDKGEWSLSADGRVMTLNSATFEYSVRLVVERADTHELRVQSQRYHQDGGVEEVVTEIYVPAKSKLTLAR